MKISFKSSEQEFINGVKQSYGSRKKLIWDIAYFILTFAFGIYLYFNRFYPLMSIALMVVPILYFGLLVWRYQFDPKRQYEKEPLVKEE